MVVSLVHALLLIYLLPLTDKYTRLKEPTLIIVLHFF